MSTPSSPWKFSRSHQIAYVECPRLAWLRYYDAGHGWESAKLDLHRATGSLVHAMQCHILRRAQEVDSIPAEYEVDNAVAIAVATYRNEVELKGFDLSTEGSNVFEMQRQSALAEALTRAWVRLRLPSILSTHRILHVEEEWEIPIDDPGDMVCMVRLDAVLERRSDGDLWAMETKTTGWMSDDWLESWRYDSQTLMHCWAVERKLGRPCGGVLLEALYKGAKRSDDSGTITYYSPLIRGYLKRGVPPFDEDELSWDSSMGRRKGWEPVDVWQWGKVKEWVALIPEEVVAQQLFSREIYRSTREQETWLRQTLVQQDRIQHAVGDMNEFPDWDIVLMDDFFPARLDASCYSNKFRQRCTFLPVCFGEVDNIAESGLYRVREPHHPAEFEA